MPKDSKCKMPSLHFRQPPQHVRSVGPLVKEQSLECISLSKLSSEVKEHVCSFVCCLEPKLVSSFVQLVAGCWRGDNRTRYKQVEFHRQVLRARHSPREGCNPTPPTHVCVDAAATPNPRVRRSAAAQRLLRPALWASEQGGLQMSEGSGALGQ